MLQLPESDQQLLLKIARDAVGSYLLIDGRTPQPPAIPSSHERMRMQARQGAAVNEMDEFHGIFVSLHKGTELRGCIGNIDPTEPLYRSAADCAISAAVLDPRFMPLTGPELAEVTFEISVLSEMIPVSSPDEIEIGTHGLHIAKGTARGLLLPQVARTYGWNRERFLAKTCRKAGLKRDDWKSGAIIHRFYALVFKEHRLQLSAIS